MRPVTQTIDCRTPAGRRANGGPASSSGTARGLVCRRRPVNASWSFVRGYRGGVSRALTLVLGALVAALLAAAAPAARAAGASVRVGAPIVLPGITEIDGFACAGGGVCEAVGENDDGHAVAVRVTNGKPALAMPVAGASGGFTLEAGPIICLTADYCLAEYGFLGARGAIAGGEIVSIVNGAPSPPRDLRGARTYTGFEDYGLSCTSRTKCVASGSDGLIQITNGMPGTFVPYRNEFLGPDGGIICPRGHCEILAIKAMPSSPTTYGELLPIDGLRYGAPRVVPHTASTDFAACGSGRCEIVGPTSRGDAEAAESLIGGRFGPPVPISIYTSAVACLSATTCVVAAPASAEGTAVTPITGNTAGKPIGAPFSPASASACTAPGRCYIAGETKFRGALLPLSLG